jgi:hypothetical protein
VSRARALGLVLAGAVAAAAVLLPVTDAPAAPARDSPPECVTAKLVAPSGRIAWVVACGSGPRDESPWQDWVSQPARQQIIMDGTRHIDPYNCPKANPCVLIADNSPGS